MSTLDAREVGARRNAEDEALELAPDSWPEGGRPDPLNSRRHGPVGTPLSRLDGPLKVQGRAPFAAEVQLEHLVYAAVAFSTVPKGSLARLDVDEAESAPGVVLVMTHHNAPHMEAMPMLMGTNARAAGGDMLPVMQDAEIHWNGQPIAVVLAETQEQADHAVSLVGATYDEKPAVTTLSEALANGTGSGVLMGQSLKIEIGDAAAALATAAASTDATYRTPSQNHNAIELHGATLAWDDGTLVVHDSSQAVVHTAVSLAEIFDLEEQQVRVTSPFVGGAFGGKMLWHHQVLGAAAAKLAGRPVRIVLSREGVYRTVGGRASTEQRVAIGAAPDGGFDAIVHTGTNVTTERTALAEAFNVPTMSMYAAGSFSLDNQLAFLDVVPNTQMRAPGGAVGTFALECAVDELAIELGMDPVDLRLRNEPERDPTAGTPFSMPRHAELWRTAAEHFGWSERNPTPRGERRGEWLVGLGCAASSHPYVRMPGGAARITITRDGRAQVHVAAHDMGMGTATVHTQVVAERLGLPVDRVTFAYGDSTFPGLVMSAGSQQTASVGAAVIAAQRQLVADLLDIVADGSPLAGLKPDEVGSCNGGLAKLSDTRAHETYAAILARAGRDQIACEADASPPIEARQFSMHSHGAMFCEVQVNAVTGETRVSRFLGAFDCGRILNPKTAASQLRGGIVMGLGMALMEETQFDRRSGRIMNPSLAEYHVPVHMDVPAIEVTWTDIPDPHSPSGAHGIGELGITGTAAAVANAVFNATGTRVRDLPITLDKLM